MGAWVGGLFNLLVGWLVGCSVVRRCLASFVLWGSAVGWLVGWLVV